MDYILNFNTEYSILICRDPEKVYANHYLMTQALDNLALQNPGMRSYADLSEDPSAVPTRSPPFWDEVDLSTDGPKVLLIGKGVHLPPSERELCKASVLRYLQENQPHGWLAAHVNLAFDRTGARLRKDKDEGVIMFKKAEINEEKISSSKYMSPARSRSNQYIILDYERYGVYIGEVLYFIKVPHLDHGSTIEPLRLPIVKFFPKPSTLSPNLWRVDRNRVLQNSSHYSVDPLSILGKVVVAIPSDSDKMFCMRYNHLTSRD